MNIQSYLGKFNTVSLSDIKSVTLMNRVDIKFAFSIQKLPAVINDLAEYYNLLEVDGNKIQEYKSLYYDTVDRIFFLQHHNDRVNRNKVRFREYVGSGLVFLEVKLKNNKKKTIKKRIKVDSVENYLSKQNQDYIDALLGKELDLRPQHWINFNRITFADKLSKERLTIDLDLTFSNNIKSGSFEDVVIAEIKQDRHAKSSNFTRIAKKKHILPIRLSKYCMSTISLNPSVKQNRFKKKVLFMNKLKSK